MNENEIERLMRQIDKQYNEACGKYVDMFCKKQETNFEFWVSDEIGSIANIGDSFFHLSDIIYDLRSNQPKGLIFEWQQNCLENQETMVNYYAYTKGVRPELKPATRAEYKEFENKKVK